MNEFLQRLKQRKLVQWALAYVAAAFALLQGIDIVAQRFGWPEQTMRFAITEFARLKIDPVWEPIRNDPAFQQLLTMKDAWDHK